MTVDIYVDHLELCNYFNKLFLSYFSLPYLNLRCNNGRIPTREIDLLINSVWLFQHHLKQFSNA